MLHYSAIKIPYFAFFGRDSGLRPKEAPWNMLLAMGLTAFLCIAVGVYPDPLYALLPYDVAYDSYTTSHVITQLQLLLFSALAFAILVRTGIYPLQLKSVNLDFDWTYRKLLPSVGKGIRCPYSGDLGCVYRREPAQHQLWNSSSGTSAWR